MKAQNPFAPFWYTPDQDKDLPEGQRTRFKLKGLDGEQLGYVAPEFILEPTTARLTGITGKGLATAMDYGLVDWENFSNDQGVVPFVRANFGLIPHRVRVELAFQVILASHVSQAE